ncbi:MAG: pilus assembly protein PilM [Myxococcales bacterium]|nr:pilus assembly protein PilM [Myxococcales bacterium]
MARFLGIEVCEHALRGVLIRSALRKVEVERCVQIPLSAALDAPDRQPELQQAAQSLLSALPARPDGIIASITGEVCSLRRMTLPAAARKRMDDILPFELDGVLPFSTDDAVIDHQPIRTSPQELEVMVAAVLEEHVREAIADLERIGLSPRQLGVGAAALDGLGNLLPELGGGEPVLLLELADRSTDLCLMVGGRCTHARTLGYGIEDLPARAEDLARDLKRALTAMRAEGFGLPSATYLLGSGAAAEGSAAWLGDQLGLEVQPLSLPEPLEGQTSPIFGRAAALSARAVLGGHHIDVRKGEFAASETGGSLVEHVNLLTVCAVAIVMSMMFSLKAQQSTLYDEQDALRARLKTVTQEVLGAGMDDPYAVRKAIENPKNEDPLPLFDAFDALAALSGAVDPEVVHEVRRLSIDITEEKGEGRLELQAKIGTLGERDELVAQLEKHPCFRDIERGKTTPVRGEDRINYQLEVELRCPGAGPARKEKKGE